MGRRRYFISGFAFILIIWSLGTYYLAILRTSGGTAREKMGNGVDERKEQLERKLAEMEEAIRKQSQENQALLKKLQQAMKEKTPADLHSDKKQKSDSNSDGGAVAGGSQTLDGPIAVLVFACNRPAAIQAHLDRLLTLRPSASQFPVIVSQDCNHPPTTNAIKAYGDRVTLIQQPDQSNIQLPPKSRKFLGYYKISRHYKWALNHTFFHLGYKTAVITEDDLDLAVDFFEYFIATYPILKMDPTLWCVSAWNDNGKADKIENNSSLLYRTDFFPGLGWMLQREVWSELQPKWPEAFWDDWMRKPDQRRDRACIRPEISRTAMSKHGKVGVSKGLFFEKHLKLIQLNQQFFPFTKKDLSYLLKSNYDQEFVRNVYGGPSITQEELRSGKLANGELLPPAIRLTYDNKNTYKVTAKTFGLMDDFRAGVPRTAYRGVVPFMFEHTRVYLAPFPDWNGYDETWS